MALNLLADPPCFLGAIPHPDDADLVAAIGRGPQGLAEPPRVVRDKRRRGGQDMLGGAVILLEPDHCCARKILFEAQNIGDFGSAPRID